MTGQTVVMDVRKINTTVSVIDVTGSITATSEAALMEAYGAASGDRTRAIMLNFSGLEYLNSSGIGLLVTLLVRANRRKQKLMAFGLNEHYRHIFELTRLNDAILLYEDEPNALLAAHAL